MYWFILIVATSAGGVSVDHIEFDTEKDCRAAIEAIKAGETRDALSYRTFCVQK